MVSGATACAGRGRMESQAWCSGDPTGQDGIAMIEHMFDKPATAPFGLAGELVRRVSWAGCRFDAVIELHADEVERRHDAGIGGVVDYGLMESLAGLPLGFPVKREALGVAALERVVAAPQGVVSLDQETVTNTLAAPLTLVALVRHARRWRDVGTFSVFAAQVPSLVIVPHHPQDAEEAAVTLGRVGLGLASATTSGIREIIPPASSLRLGLARRCLVERVYARWLVQIAGTPANRSQAFSCFDGGKSNC